jgi:hypothetical protein
MRSVAVKHGGFQQIAGAYAGHTTMLLKRTLVK